MMSKKSTVPTSRESDKFVLRLPEGMRGKIAELAKASGRSMNAELVHRIQRTIDEDAELAESGVKIIEGLHIDRAALMTPPGTTFTPRGPVQWDPHFAEEMKEVLEYIRREMMGKDKAPKVTLPKAKDDGH